MKSKYYHTIALIGSKKTYGRTNKDCLEAFNLNNLINLLFCISMLIVFVYEGYENYLVNITIITVIYSPIMFFFSTLGYKKLLAVFYIVWQILFTSKIHISLYSQGLISLPVILLVLSLPLQAYNIFSTTRRIYRLYVLTLVLFIVTFFIVYKLNAEHLAKVHLEKDVLLLESLILIYAIVFMVLNINIISRHFTMLNNKVFNIYDYWAKREKKNNRLIDSYNQQIIQYKIKEVELMEAKRLESIKNKIYESLEQSLVEMKNIDYSLICNYIMSIFNAKHIAIYIKKDKYLQPLSIFINRIEKKIENIKELTREYIILQHILKHNKLQLLENIKNHVKQSGVSEDLYIDKMLYLELNQKHNDYILVCHAPNINNMDYYNTFFHETIEDIFTLMEKINNMIKVEEAKSNFLSSKKKNTYKWHR